MCAKKLFTKEQVEQMRQNPYTQRVDTKSISYTTEFKRAFWELSLQGYSGVAAFTKLGYDPDVIGFERIHNTTKRIRRAAQTPESVEPKPTGRVRLRKEHFKEADLAKMSHREAARRMQREIVYLQQQVEFLKKIMPQASSSKGEGK